MDISGAFGVFIQSVSHNTPPPKGELEREQPNDNWFPTAEQADAALIHITAQAE